MELEIQEVSGRREAWRRGRRGVSECIPSSPSSSLPPHPGKRGGCRGWGAAAGGKQSHGRGGFPASWRASCLILVSGHHVPRPITLLAFISRAHFFIYCILRCLIIQYHINLSIYSCICIYVLKQVISSNWKNAKYSEVREGVRGVAGVLRHCAAHFTSHTATKIKENLFL